jgi:polar amino acid transport system substrate-binding protein
MMTDLPASRGYQACNENRDDNGPSRRDFLRYATVLTGGMAMSGSLLGISVKPAHAAGTLAKIKASHYALLASYNEPPHDWFDPADGKWKGIDNDIAVHFLQTLGVKSWDFVVADWSALIPGLQAHRWDLMSVGMSITDKRKQIVAFSEPIYQYGDVIIVKKGNPEKITGKPDYNGKKIGGILGATSIDEIQAVSGAAAVPFKTHGDMVNDVAAGRISAAQAGETTASYAATVQPDPRVELLHNYVGYSPRPSGMVFRKEDTDMKGAADAELRKMKANGTLAGILAKYGLLETNIVR